MLFDSENQFQKQVGIRCAFNFSLSPDVALLFLQNTFPFVTIEEINEHYEILTAELRGNSQNGSNQANVAPSGILPVKKMKMNVECPNPSDGEQKRSIEAMPDEMLNHILENSSTKDQEALQKSSFTLSNFISNNYKTYREIEVFLTEEKIHMKVEKQEHRVMKGSQIGSKRKFSADDTSERIDSKTYFPATISETLQKLEAIFKPKTAKITSLKIHYEENKQFHQRITEFISGFQNMLNDLKYDLHVEKLTIGIYDSDQLLSVLNKLKPGLLKTLNLINCQGHRSIDMTNIVTSEHWRHIKEFVSRSFELNLHLDQFIHIPSVNGFIYELTIEKVLNYKNKLIQTPPEKLSQYLISNKLEGLFEAFKPFTPDADFTVKGGSFLCNDNRRLHFKIDSYILRLYIV